MLPANLGAIPKISNLRYVLPRLHIPDQDLFWSSVSDKSRRSNVEWAGFFPVFDDVSAFSPTGLPQTLFVKLAR